MSLDYKIDRAGRIASVSAHANLDESLRAIRTLASDIRLEDGIGVLIDLRGFEHAPSWEEADALARTIATSGVLRQHRVALLASGRADFALANMIATLSGLKGATVHAFQSFDSATSWLKGVPSHLDQRRN
ncbi:MAG: hypothetical protein E6K76_10215 [Candidatus Eisenbacteria bacterium]|uniref:STAS/SEC14 domain-containing protein n=1 Tax=Eiseniibacteriota bacterium TaxID=2212470 RepID=A0A538T1P2_UNCEI|nr:MAG: hypothetical protein E6K76_10215 [Candidatus Eisenbacteria bacterium]